MPKDPADVRKIRLSQPKRALLSAWLDDAPQLATPTPLASSLPDQKYEPFPLSTTQEAYWLGRNSAFQLGLAPTSYIELECENFDVVRFELALTRLVARHDMLRAIVQPDGQQRILATVPPLHIESLDISGLCPELQLAELESTRRRLMQSLGRTDRWPLFSIAASRLDNIYTRVHIAFDILMIDVQSVRILTRDLGFFYRDSDVVLPPISISFRDLAVAERIRKQEPEYDRARRYWHARLDDLPGPPSLPLARRPAEIAKPFFVRRQGVLPAPLWAALKDRAARAQLTPTAALLTAFSETLARRAVSSRFTLNLTLYNRPMIHPQIEEVVGDFTSLLLVEVDLAFPEDFQRRAEKIQKQIWTDLEHDLFDGVEVIRERMRRMRSRAPAFPIVLTSNLSMDAGDEWDRSTQPLGRVVHAVTQTPQVWIDHQVTEHDGNLVYSWDVVEELFSPGFIDDMILDYQNRLVQLGGSDGHVWSQANPLSTQDSASSMANATSAPDNKGRNERQAIEERIRAHIASVLGQEPIEHQASLLDLGLTSIDIIRIANAMQDEFDVRPELETLFEQDSIASIAAMYMGMVMARRDTERDVLVKSASTLILDPQGREEFKQRELALRRDLDGCEEIALSHAETGTRIEIDLTERCSRRSFSPMPVDLQSLGNLLGFLRRGSFEGSPKYAYPSAGGLYPVQIYLYVQPGRVAKVPGGTYYYHPARHSLVTLTKGALLDRTVHAWMNRAIFDGAAFSVFLVADARVMSPMYGNLTADFCMYEAGAIGQLAEMVAPTCGLGLCSIGRIDLQLHRHLFRWHASHCVLHTLLGGGLLSRSATEHFLDHLVDEVAGLGSEEVEVLLRDCHNAPQAPGRG
jgi:SagB-type dehydrogenase family enzyme